MPSQQTDVHTTSIHGQTHSPKPSHQHGTMASPPSPLWLKLQQGEWHMWTEWILPATNWAQTLNLPLIPCLLSWDSPGQGRPFVPWVTLIHVLACPCVPVLFQAYGDRQAFDGSHDGSGNILAGQAITWASTPSTLYLNSFLHVLMSFLQHNPH